MNGPVAQIASICSYSNAMLQNDVSTQFTMSHSTAQFCKTIKFIDWVPAVFLGKLSGHKKFKEKLIAETFDKWVQFLKNNGTKGLWLHYVSSDDPKLGDRLSSAFVGGGGRWLIEANYGKYSDYWEARWKTSKRQDNRVWDVTYGRIARKDINRLPIRSSLFDIITQLSEAISACEQFAQKHDIKNFCEFFKIAKDYLSNEAYCSDKIYHKDLIPERYYSKEAQRILLACQVAWVFGGMGSWNDLGFQNDEQNTYEKISDDLYLAICNAIPNAINSFQNQQNQLKNNRVSR